MLNVMSRNLVKTVLIRTLPITTGYIVLGMGFGILLQDAGYSPIWAFLMSLFIYSGTMEYVGVDLLSSGASLVAAAIMALVVNCRYMFYGLSMIDKYKGTGWMKPILAFGLTDENYALLTSSEPPAGSEPKMYYFLISVIDHGAWILGSVLGVLVSEAFAFNTAGVDFVMTALFTTVMVSQWRETKNHIPALLGVGLSVLWLLILGPEHFLIPAMISITAALALVRRWVDA